jgi:hypothetical protein
MLLESVRIPNGTGARSATCAGAPCARQKAERIQSANTPFIVPKFKLVQLPFAVVIVALTHSTLADTLQGFTPWLWRVGMRVDRGIPPTGSGGVFHIRDRSGPNLCDGMVGLSIRERPRLQLFRGWLLRIC